MTSKGQATKKKVAKKKVAKKKNVSTSKLIRSYIKEGMTRDKELSSSEEKEFGDTNMF